MVAPSFSNKRRLNRFYLSLLIVSGLLIFTISAQAADVVFEISGADQEIGISGHDGELWHIAEKYVAQTDQTVCAVKLGLGQTNAGGEYITLIAREGGANPDEGSFLAVASVAGSSLPTHAYDSDAEFVLDQCLQLTAGQTYWFDFAGPFFIDSSVEYTAAYRSTDEFSYTEGWEQTLPVFEGDFDPNTVWHQNTGEWGIKLEGGDVSSAKEPVIIVPGILGTRLNRVSDGSEVWPNIEKMSTLGNNGDAYLNELILDSSGTETGSKMTPAGLLDKVSIKVVYKNLVDDLLNAGYASGTDLFTFPYDWRFDLDIQISQLDSVVKQAIASSPTGKVNIIAHSIWVVYW